MLEVKATSKYLRTSAQKAGLVLQLIRGKKASDALSILRFTKKSVARDVEKTLRSAIANAVNVADKNQKRRLDEDDLVVSAAYADQGPTQKRVRPAPMGRAYQVLRRTTHVTVCVAEQEEGGVVRSGASPKKGRSGSSAAARSMKSDAERGRQVKESK
jgi:large subunit ribosomal protein L22